MHLIFVKMYSSELDKCNNIPVLLPYSKQKIQSYTAVKLLQWWTHTFVRRVLKDTPTCTHRWQTILRFSVLLVERPSLKGDGKLSLVPQTWWRHLFSLHDILRLSIKGDGKVSLVPQTWWRHLISLHDIYHFCHLKCAVSILPYNKYCWNREISVYPVKNTYHIIICCTCTTQKLPYNKYC